MQVLWEIHDSLSRNQCRKNGHSDDISLAFLVTIQTHCGKCAPSIRYIGLPRCWKNVWAQFCLIFAKEKSQKQVDVPRDGSVCSACCDTKADNLVDDRLNLLSNITIWKRMIIWICRPLLGALCVVLTLVGRSAERSRPHGKLWRVMLMGSTVAGCGTTDRLNATKH